MEWKIVTLCVSTIEALCHLFEEQVVSHNGPQFVAGEFAIPCLWYQLLLVITQPNEFEVH